MNCTICKKPIRLSPSAAEIESLINSSFALTSNDNLYDDENGRSYSRDEIKAAFPSIFGIQDYIHKEAMEIEK
jgi:hypothetical protein